MPAPVLLLRVRVSLPRSARANALTTTELSDLGRNGRWGDREASNEVDTVQKVMENAVDAVETSGIATDHRIALTARPNMVRVAPLKTDVENMVVKAQRAETESAHRGEVVDLRVC